MLEVEPTIIERYVATGQLRIVYRHLLQLGSETELLAEASECAADQGRFWAYRYTLYERINDSYRGAAAAAEAAATALNLDLEQFSRCLSEQTHREFVRADYAAAQAEGIRSRPVFRLGDQLIIGSRPLNRFLEPIEAALASP